jgi:TATA-box binding protein (TBP) (component of TFIID and TFIIIB)
LQIDREFNNSIVVKYEFETVTMAIKLFVNGNLQISGCRCVEDTLLNNHMMCRFLERTSKVEPGTYTVVDFDIHVVNINFVLGVPTLINLAELHDHINQNYRLFQRYDLSNHVGLIITKMSCVSNASNITTMVFKNAQCIITGWKMREELVDAYNTILAIADEAYDQIAGSTASAALRII